MNTKIKKGMINAIIFLFFVSLTFYIIFKDNSIPEIFEIIKTVDKKFIVIAFLCMCSFVLSEGINIMRTLKLLDCKLSLKNGIKYAFVRIFL